MSIPLYHTFFCPSNLGGWQRFLIQAKYDRFFEIFLVALSTGLRRGEDMALKWEDLNLDTGELKVRRQVKRTKGRLVISEPKTEESVRTIILPKSLVSILKEYKETIDSEWMFPSPRVEGMPRDLRHSRKNLTLP